MRNEAYGMNHDMYPRWLIWTYLEQKMWACPNVFILYPGSDATGDGETVTYPDDWFCGEFVPMYEVVLKYPRKQPFLMVLQSSFRDVYDMHGVVSFGTDEKGILGFFEMQFESIHFPLLVDPVLPKKGLGYSTV